MNVTLNRQACGDMGAELHRVSKGDPLLVRLYVDDLVSQGEKAARLTPESLSAIPNPVSRATSTDGGKTSRRCGGRNRQCGKRRSCGSPAPPCAMGPLAHDDVLRLTPRELGGDTFVLKEALRPLTRFVIGDGVEQGYVFSHPRLRNYFYDTLSEPEHLDWDGRFLAWGEERSRRSERTSAPAGTGVSVSRYLPRRSPGASGRRPGQVAVARERRVAAGMEKGRRLSFRISERCRPCMAPS